MSTTGPLEEPVTIAGTVRAVSVSSDAKDTDFTAKLLDVDRSGKSWNIVNGVARARYREGLDNKVWMEKGRVHRIELSLKATAIRFERGHRIGLHVSSSDFPLYERTSTPAGTTSTKRLGSRL